MESKTKSTKPKIGGKEILGYSITGFLGSGGFSWVLEGQKRGKTFALKFTELCNEEEEPEKYMRQLDGIAAELDVLKCVRHKNIVKMKSFRKSVEYRDPQDVVHPTCCFVLEACRKFDLFDFVYFSGKFEENLARYVFSQVASAVRCLHEAGYAHRDIKAQNVLFTNDFVAKVTDFGGSKRTNHVNMLTTCVGTTGYQAPELLLNRPYTKRCDTFSLGVLLFIMTHARPPHQEALGTDKWFRNLAKKPARTGRFWRMHKSKASSKLKSIIEEMLSYQPHARLKSDEILSHPWLQQPKLELDVYVSLMESRAQMCKSLGSRCSNSRCDKFAGMH